MWHNNSIISCLQTKILQFIDMNLWPTCSQPRPDVHCTYKSSWTSKWVHYEKSSILHKRIRWNMVKPLLDCSMFSYLFSLFIWKQLSFYLCKTSEQIWDTFQMFWKKHRKNVLYTRAGFCNFWLTKSFITQTFEKCTHIENGYGWIGSPQPGKVLLV